MSRPTALGAAVAHRIVIRAGADVTTRHRFRDGARIYRIVAVRDSADRRFLEIDAEERAGLDAFDCNNDPMSTARRGAARRDSRCARRRWRAHRAARRAEESTTSRRAARRFPM